MKKTEVFRRAAQELLLTSTWDFYVNLNLTTSNKEDARARHDLFITIHLN
jgi:hypothetical protein